MGASKGVLTVLIRGSGCTPETVSGGGSIGMGASKGDVHMKFMKEAAAAGMVGTGMRAPTGVITMIIMVAMEAIKMEFKIGHLGPTSI